MVKGRCGLFVRLIAVCASAVFPDAAAAPVAPIAGDAVHVQRISAKRLSVIASPNGKFLWALPKRDTGFFGLDVHGNLRQYTHPRLADTLVSEAHPLGDSGYVVLELKAPADQPLEDSGVFLVGPSIDSEPRRLFPEENLFAVRQTDRGLYLGGQSFIGSPVRAGQRILSSTRQHYFISSHTREVAGPWADEQYSENFESVADTGIAVAASAYWYTGKNSELFFGFGRLRPPGHAFNVRIFDPMKGIRTRAMQRTPSGVPGSSPPALFSGSGGTMWIVPTQFPGIALLDIEAALSGSEIPPDAFHWIFENELMEAHPMQEGRLLAFARGSAESAAAPGAYLVWNETPSRPVVRAVPELANLLIEQAVVLGPERALIQGTLGTVEGIYFWRMGIDVVPVQPQGESIPTLGRVWVPGLFERWQATADASGRKFLLSKPTDPSAAQLLLFDSEQLTLSSNFDRDTAVSSVAGTKVWLQVDGSDSMNRGLSLFDLEQGAPAWSTSLFADSSCEAFVPIRGSNVGFATDARYGTFRVEYQQPRIPIQVKLGSELLDLESPPSRHSLAFDPQAAVPQAFVTITDALAGGINRDARVVSTIRCAAGSQMELTSAAINQPGVPVQHGVTGRSESPVPLNEPCSLTITYSDFFGSHVAWTWPDVRFTPQRTLMEQLWFRTLLAYLSLVLLAFLVAQLRGGLQRWLPVVTYVGGGGAIALLASGEVVNPWWLAAALTATAMLATALGLCSSSVFRSLLRVEPFTSTGPLMLSVPSIRRRILGPYVERLRRQLAIAREQSVSETYVALPVRIRQASVGGAHAVDAQGILAALSTENLEERAHILIEAPGGRGKSALLRRVVELALDAYERDPSSPLPIVCYGVEDDLPARIQRGLGAQGFPQTVLETLLEAGEYFIVIDGLAESAVTPKHVLDYLSRFGQRAPLLLSARSNRAYHEPLQHSARWWIAEPERLTEEALEDFLRGYDCDPRQFDAPTRALCRNVEGYYLPILVRLAIVSLAQGPSSTTDIYRRAVERLLKRDDALFDEAARLCLETYWITGVRTILFASADATQRAVLRKLLEAGLVVAVGERLDDSHDPATVRFFHDSIQTYLTAVGLSRRREDWSSNLIEAAAHERFSRESSDFLFASGTELYQLCLITFGGPDEISGLLVEALRRFLEVHSGAFSRDWVMNTRGLPEGTQEIGVRASGADALLAVIEMCVAQKNFPAIAAVFARTARLLWPRLRADSEKKDE